MDAAKFRQDFPEFADTTVYPDSQVTFFGALAESLLPECRWGTLWPFGVELFIAHQLALAGKNSKTSEAGGTPGAVTGPMTAKSVDKVSASYDAGAVTLEDGGFWNSTTYGTQLLFYARMIGAGGVQL
ncbi:MULTISPECIES: DUF4054 domain-containing protein [unclassified Achromobacter]|uniref:DUF4054 domain-containing protein n=1 Tax=unclassified Achromobacter TaxID=2626865 RepID=UPI000B519DB9|nr:MULTISPECIES: DUF4054 domain-containing protein [unclassified Achromobacter]OWT69217.1 hypothetical protein CEY05_28740 [Achromobacter sp. HZ34]OWT70622.1 hypothetical protein CEY04_27570 [Achromobacter sp. HZ28]